jgi:hypothetical protein
MVVWSNFWSSRSVGWKMEIDHPRPFETKAAAMENSGAWGGGIVLLRYTTA